MNASGTSQSVSKGVRNLILGIQVVLVSLLWLGGTFAPYLFESAPNFFGAASGTDDLDVLVLLGKSWLVISFLVTVLISWVYYLTETHSMIQDSWFSFIIVFFVCHIVILITSVVLFTKSSGSNLTWNLLAVAVASLVTLVDLVLSKRTTDPAIKSSYQETVRTLDFPILAAMFLVMVTTYLWEKEIAPPCFVADKSTFLAGFSAGANAVVIVVGNLCFHMTESRQAASVTTEGGVN